ncbi:NAD(P)H-dependent oxidoreductase [Variovorax sp. J22R133]|uniref:NAD(P)H-dependent oxidoreductase n=1 Tax=Variovorax brevis TaxID=3053503 RepID=UPI002578238D|nr:NAD(P)H-dependent oxidoreductase [Variovorax sp. J22R133]MDM0110900.1 NAD(P)H-dependent oxidoreductase [Variovorax sp. J22R133]
MQASIVIGDPKARSRTARAAAMLATALTGNEPAKSIEVVGFGPDALGRKRRGVEAAVGTVARSRLVIVASPIDKGTYTDLLKVFLGQFDGVTGLHDVVAIPLMLGASSVHGTAAERLLKPVLVKLGALCPAPGLFLLEKGFEDGLAIQSYANKWGNVVRAGATLRAHGRRSDKSPVTQSQGDLHASTLRDQALACDAQQR